MIQEGYQPLSGFNGFLLLKLPQDIISEIKISVDEIQTNFLQAIPANDKLAGQIDKEYNTNLTHKATQYIKESIGIFNKCNPNLLFNMAKQFGNDRELHYKGEAWINFQKKHEYNPIHNHSGIFSYVIWYQIPYYKEDEIKYGAGKYIQPEHNQNGDFVFVVPNGVGMETHPLSIDKRGEGYIAIFPSSLHHQVYPFYTSDNYRITISGNIVLK